MKSILRNDIRVPLCGMFGLFLIVFSANFIFAQKISKARETQHLSEKYGKLPLYFEQNLGQTSKETKFISRGSRYALFLTSNGSVLELQAPDKNACDFKDVQCAKRRVNQPELNQTSVLRMNFLGSHGAKNIVGDHELEGKANYLLGNDPQKWITNVPIFTKVHYSQIYPGIDLVYYGNQEQLEYDLVLQAKVDPTLIRIGIQGADKIGLDKSGNLLIKTAAGTVALQKPVMYQVTDGNKKQVKGEYVLRAANEVGFKIESYDKNVPLVVDPVLIYSTYFGGTGQNSDFGSGEIAIDQQGNTYITGTTTATDFPATQTIGTLKTDGSALMFVTKINPTGTGIVYSTYIGGTGANIHLLNETDEPTAIATDTNGYAYVSGETSAPDFPTTSTGYQTTLIGSEDAFLIKLSADGQSLIYSTYLGGGDYAGAVGVDANQIAYLTGSTLSSGSTVPITSNAYQTVNHSSNGNAFVSKIDTTKSGANSLIYSTFLGGSSPNSLGDIGNGIAADSAGKIYVTGATSSTDFPVTSNAYQSSGGIPDGNAFLSVFDPSQSGSASLVYSTYFGGTDSSGTLTDFGYALDLDQSGKVYIAGSTSTLNFPITIGGQPTGSLVHAFVAKFDTTQSGLSSLIYSRAFGNIYAVARGLAVDSLGNAYIGGFTKEVPNSIGPTPLTVTPDAVQSSINSLFCGFITVVSPDASTVLYGTYFGSSDGTGAFISGLMLDPNSNFYVAGATFGIDVPTTQQLYQPTLEGTEDLFIAKFSAISSPTITSLSPSQGVVGTPITIAGTNFGSTQGTSTVTFNGTTAVPSSWSATSIVVPVPSGATTGNVVVTVNGVASNSARFVVTSLNAINLVQDTLWDSNGASTTTGSVAFNSANTAGNLIVVCIRAGAGNETFTITDTLGNTYQQAFTITEPIDDDSMAIYYAQNIAGGANTVTVSDTSAFTLRFSILEYSGVSATNALDIETAAVGASASPNSGTATTSANGDLIVGAVGTAGSDNFTAGTGYTIEEYVPFQASPRLIVEDMRQAVAGPTSASVTIGASDDWSAGFAAFKPAVAADGTAPAITGVYPSSGVTGTSVTITGTDFGATQGTSTVKFNGTVATPTSWSAMSITVTVPTGATTGNVTVTEDAIPSNGVSFTVLATPAITSLSPTSGSTGTSVTINGSNFGSTQGTSTVTFNGVAATPTTWTNTQIKAPVPAAATTGNVVVTMNGVSSTGTHTFTVSGAPTISSLSPTSGSVGTSVTIHGTNFGSTQGTSTVSFNGVNATPTSWSSTQVKAPVPSGATTGNVVVTVSSKPTTGTHTFTVTGTPTISGMTPNAGGVGTMVTITGTNLGTTGTITFNGVATSVWSWTSTQITAPVPISATTGNVVVTISGENLPAVGNFTVNSTIPIAATEYSYDSMGRVTQTMTCTPMNCGTGQGFLMTYSYDVAGNLTTLTSNGTSIQYSPADSPIDSAGNITKVESSWVDSQHPATLTTINSSVGYSPGGQLQNLTYGNGITESSVYNNQLQPCRINVNSSGTLLSTCIDALPSGNIQDFNLNYNAATADNGNVVGFAASGQQNFNRSYVYDNLNRLQTMSAPGDACSGLLWIIDAWGNRTAQNTTGGSCFSPQISVDTNNRITGAPQNCTASTPFCYDAAGNLLNDGNHSYFYDAENHITKVDGGTTANYVYDANGNRIEKTTGSADSQYLYDNNGQINAVFNAGLFQRMYIYLAGKQFAEYYNNSTYFAHMDNLGSTRLLTGMDESVQESDDYYPYGEPMTAGMQDLFKFTSKERDNESNLDDFIARHYSSSLGRFMQTDPDTGTALHLINPQRWNMYGYALGNPMTYTDPEGRDAVAVNFPMMVGEAGHQGIIAIDDNGTATFGEFGPVSHSAGNWGGAAGPGHVSLDQQLPKVEFDSDHHPTAQSINALKAAIAKNDENGIDPNAIRFTYFPTSETDTILLKNWLAQQNENPGNYRLFAVRGRQNCAVFCVRGLVAGNAITSQQAAGLSFVPDILYWQLSTLEQQKHDKPLREHIKTKICFKKNATSCP